MDLIVDVLFEEPPLVSVSVIINRLFAYCKGGNLNIHTWASFGYFIC